MKTVVGIVTVFVMVLLSAHSSSAQDKFSLSISGAPAYSYSNIRQNFIIVPGDGSEAIVLPDFATKTKGYSYTVGVMGKYEFVPRWSVATGVWMSYNRTNPPNLPPYVPADLLVGQSHQRNVQIPMLVNFQSSTRRLSPYFSAGALLSFRSPTYLNIGNGQEIRLIIDKHSVAVVPTIGVGAIYRMSNHLSLSVQPTFNYYLPQGTYSSYFSGRASLQTQLFYTF
jgi:hypothetical protein